MSSVAGALSQVTGLAGHSPGGNDPLNAPAAELMDATVEDLGCISQIFPDT